MSASRPAATITRTGRRPRKARPRAERLPLPPRGAAAPVASRLPPGSEAAAVAAEVMAVLAAFGLED